MLITFVLPVKAAEAPEHKIYSVIIGLDFEECKRVLADSFAVPLD